MSLHVWLIFAVCAAFIGLQFYLVYGAHKRRPIRTHEWLALAKNIVVFSGLASFFFWLDRALGKVHTTVVNGETVTQGLSALESQLFAWSIIAAGLLGVVLRIASEVFYRRWFNTYGKALIDEHELGTEEGERNLARLGVLNPLR